ncbi:ABC transporter substrate-binding protein [Haliangium sp.]|uniref:ABC transporter substrate-binding protein n=1 Tax=Haliangium sp. TaxID=2663208 RepID=UPI003D0F05AE
MRRTPDDTVVVLFGALIRDLDPRFALGSNDIKLSRLVAPGLTSVDQPSLEPAPALAERIEQRDQLTWDVHLRADVRFSDGSPLTAEDVVYSFSSVLDPEVGSLYRPSFADRFERVEAVGAHQVRFHLAKPLATFLSDLDFGIVSAGAGSAPNHRFPDGKVIGAGPYRVASVATERILLERNPYYYGPAPSVERLEIRTVRDANARALMLVGGSADLAQNAIRLDLADAVAERKRVRVESGPSAILTYLMMHNQDPVLADVRVRRAIAHAIDRERIVQIKLGGRAVLATGLLPPSHWAYEGEVQRYPYDPERARALLDEAGYPDPDGPGGAPRLRLSYKTSADAFRLGIARIIAAQLGEVGIEVDVRSFEFGTFLADIKQGNFQLASMQTAAITEPDFYFAYFHSSRIPTPESPHTTNRWRYRDDRVDELTAAGRSDSDRDRRLAVYREVQRILARDVPIVPLWHEDNVAVMNIDLRGYRILPNASMGGLAGVSKQRR